MVLALRRSKKEARSRRPSRKLIIGTPIFVAFCVLGMPDSILERGMVAVIGALALSYLSNRPGPVAMSLIPGFVVMNIALPFLFKLGLPAPVIRTMGFWKEMLVGALAVAAFRHRRNHPTKLDTIDRLGIAFVVLTTGYWLFPNVLTSIAIPLSSSARQVAFRGVALPVIALLAVRHVPISDVWRRRCLGAAVFAGLLLTVGSILEMSFPHWWDNFLSNTVGLADYRRIILGAPRGSVLSYADFNAGKSQRSGTWYAEPLVAGFTYDLPLAAALAVALARPKLRALVGLGLIGTGLFLVQGRAALLAGLVVVIAAVVRRDKASPVTRTNLGLVVGAFAIVAFPFFAASALGHRSAGAVNGQDTISAPSHITSSKQAFDRVIRFPLGTGLGSSGGNAERFGVSNGAVSEDYFLGVGIDVGIVGMVLDLALVIAVISAGFRKSTDAIGFVAVSALLGTAVGGLFLHSLESPVVAVPAFVAVGLAVTTTRINETDSPRRPALRR